VSHRGDGLAAITRPLEVGPIWGLGRMVRLGVAKIAARRGTLLKLAAAAMFAFACAASPAKAEMQIGVYGGWNGSFDSDIHLTQPAAPT
jgi:hypothetical protein